MEQVLEAGGLDSNPGHDTAESHKPQQPAFTRRDLLSLFVKWENS